MKHPKVDLCLDDALTEAVRLLGTDAARAEHYCNELLKKVPGHPKAMLLLATARRCCGRYRAALDILDALVAEFPDSALVHYERALSLESSGQGQQAIGALERAVALHAGLAPEWKPLAARLAAGGATRHAKAARDRLRPATVRWPELVHAADALNQNDVPRAEALLRRHLDRCPADVIAMRMLAEVAGRLRRYLNAERLLERCLELSPHFIVARQDLALVLHRQNRPAEALTHVQHLIAAEPVNPNFQNLLAGILSALGEHERAIEIYDSLVASLPGQGKLWLSYGHVLKTAGRRTQCEQAYRNAIRLLPELGEGYWSLANLKTFRFSQTDIVEMNAKLGRDNLTAENKFHFHFAIAKAYEDGADFESSFSHYLQANAQRRRLIHYSSSDTSARVSRARQLFSAAFFQERREFGAHSNAPIFIVGMPRAGSTLLEQILSSHSEVEGTAELSNIIALARRISDQESSKERTRYPEVIGTLSRHACAGLGEQYLRETLVHRKSSKPMFVDKMPNNFLHVGLIHLILPQAKIIDARRHPLGCCFSSFKQHFARGHHFSYNLEELGRYYRDYVELMAIYDEALPNRVHRVFYERLVDDPEGEIRRLLAYCELPFQESCLHFHENDRPVRTASSEQVRQPLYRSSLHAWQHFEKWLDPLKSALGSVLSEYPDVPCFD